MTVTKRARIAKDALDITRTDHAQRRQYPAAGEYALKIYDVTLTLRPDMTTWSKEPGPRIEPLRRIARGDTSNVSVLTLGDHTGTHVDPPIHFLEGGATADQLPIDAMVGPCVVVRHEGKDNVSAEWLASAHVPKGTQRLLIRTTNSELWNDPTQEFTRDIVAVNASAARWCVEHGIRLVGIDYLTIEPQGPEKAGYPTHHTLLGAGVVIIEGLDLRGIGAGEYELVCAPLKIAGGDGAPARVFLIAR